VKLCYILVLVRRGFVKFATAVAIAYNVLGIARIEGIEGVGFGSFFLS
jgi:hypothetical protein